MKTLFGTYPLLIIAVLVAIHVIGCGENVTQETITAPNPEDTNVINETEENVDTGPIQTDGQPVAVTDATFESVVLDAELPVVLELGAEW